MSTLLYYVQSYNHSEQIQYLAFLLRSIFMLNLDLLS